MKLNLGAGRLSLPGYVNIDRCYEQGYAASDKSPSEVWGEIYPLPFDDGTISEVRCSHTLEHFPHAQTAAVLAEWIRVLKPGGLLKIAVPNFEWIARKYLAMIDEGGEHINVQGYVMGGQTDENDFHKAIFSRAGLVYGMEQAGLVDIQDWVSEEQDCAALPVSLNLMGRKPTEITLGAQTLPMFASHGIAETIRPIAGDPRNTEEPSQIVFDRSLKPIQAIMSMPRLAFTTNMFCCNRLSLFGVPIETFGGAYWEQGLTRGMERHIDDGTKYLLTLDYDSVFDIEDVMTLYRIMETCPDIDALASMQVRRENYTPLVTIANTQGAARGEITREELQRETIPVRTAHFGLTLLRVESLARLSKPWLISVPDASGQWGEGRMDADVNLWHKWHEEGLTLHMANRVVAGHLQQMLTWPDGNLVSRSQFYSEYQENGKPGWVWR